MPATAISFQDLDLPAILLHNLSRLGHELPTPIQAAAIPPQLAGRDVLGQAQTGTGKTAAFGLPLLAALSPDRHAVQALVLTPTRELAMQVGSALEQYGQGLPGARVALLYGGSGYREQLRDLQRGATVVVGTPGRVMDHLRRGSLDLSALSLIVLDEADEMLRMGFVDDVEWILQQAPSSRQTVLFSATMAPAIHAIAQRHLNQPVDIALAAEQITAEGVRQRYLVVADQDKSAALLRLLEVEPVDGAIVFVRTRVATQELAQQLQQHGLTAAGLSGELPQALREQTVERFRRGELDVLVATDVAARGLDVERISHVFNYDAPFDREAYVHRIGRTGRAGRNGEAILFINHRQRRLRQALEHHTGQRIEALTLPDAATVNQARMARLGRRLATVLNEDLTVMEEVVSALQRDSDLPWPRIAAAAAWLAHGGPLQLEQDRPPTASSRPARPRPPRTHRGSEQGGEVTMARFRVAVGHRHGVRPGNLVGAIANEAGLTRQLIGRIDIRAHYSLVELPARLAPAQFQRLQRTRVCGQPLQLRSVEAGQGR